MANSVSVSDEKIKKKSNIRLHFLAHTYTHTHTHTLTCYCRTTDKTIKQKVYFALDRQGGDINAVQLNLVKLDPGAEEGYVKQLPKQFGNMTHFSTMMDIMDTEEINC